MIQVSLLIHPTLNRYDNDLYSFRILKTQKERTFHRSEYIHIQDSTSIEAGYSAGAGEAGGSYSKERSETKEYAADAQTYIYSLDLECTKAQASLVGYNKIFWNENFINNLRLLPDSFVQGTTDMAQYETFWNTFGTHVIKSGKLGGSIRGAYTVDKCSVEESYSSSESYEVCLNAAYKGASANGCYGESDSEAFGTSVSNSITNKRIVMKGGSTTKFTETFNSFNDKTNDFQSWIDTLDNNPDIVGGNLDEIHDALKTAILLGNHKINVASDVDLTDTQWNAKLTALGEAYEYQTTQIVAEDSIFDATECQLSCGEGELDLEECVCNECSETTKCCGLNTSDAQINFVNIVHFVMMLLISFCVLF